MHVHFIVVLSIFYAEEGLFRDEVDQEGDIDENEQDELNNRIIERNCKEYCGQELVQIANQRKRNFVWSCLSFNRVREN